MYYIYITYILHILHITTYQNSKLLLSLQNIYTVQICGERLILVHGKEDSHFQSFDLVDALILFRAFATVSGSIGYLSTLSPFF